MKQPQKQVAQSWGGLKARNLQRISEMRADARDKEDAVKKVDFGSLRNILSIVGTMGFVVSYADAYVPYGYSDPVDGQVELSFQVKSVEGFKTPKMLGLMGYLDGRFGAEETRDNVSDWDAERVFKFGNTKKSGCPISVRMTVDVDGSETCRKVKTMVEKVQTVAEFVLVCD